jgi:hypothetical protein
LKQGWVEFVRDYAPIARTLLSHYFPALMPDLDLAVSDVFARAHVNGNAWFQSLRFTNEREFAMTFRNLVFESGRSQARLPGPDIPADSIFALLNGLSLVQRQFFLLFLSGWQVYEASRILMNASATAEETKKAADDRLASLPGGQVERAAITLLAIEAAQTRGGADCLTWKTFNNLVNGQISWNSRDAAEQHMTNCVHCLEAFTAFQEMIWLRKETTTFSDQEIQGLIEKLHIRGGVSKGLFSRILSRAS